ncbi:MAG: hypothetical protein LBJ01_05590 [Tannerella sp.]|jgi:hypothetical protein|nr:hypothetical protein [Tannerella sp.]
MKAFNSTERETGVRARHDLVLHSHYSKADFFCEGQEKCVENTERAGIMKTKTKTAKQEERFSGHFNMFL